MKYLIIILSGLTFFACTEPQKSIEAIPLEEEAGNSEIVSSRTQIPAELLELKSEEKVELTDDMLFGKFFNDRAEFFIIDQPINKVFESPIRTVTLCYLDDLLSKTTFVIEKNISSELMANYGNFRISGHDLKNRELIASGDIWEEKGKRLSPDLDNFRMAWSLGEQEIWFRVDKKRPEPYVYIEMTDQYRRMIRMIEATY